METGAESQTREMPRRGAKDKALENRVWQNDSNRKRAGSDVDTRSTPAAKRRVSEHVSEKSQLSTRGALNSLGTQPTRHGRSASGFSLDRTRFDEDLPSDSAQDNDRAHHLLVNHGDDKGGYDSAHSSTHDQNQGHKDSEDEYEPEEDEPEDDEDLRALEESGRGYAADKVREEAGHFIDEDDDEDESLLLDTALVRRDQPTPRNSSQRVSQPTPSAGKSTLRSSNQLRMATSQGQAGRSNSSSQSRAPQNSSANKHGSTREQPRPKRVQNLINERGSFGPSTPANPPTLKPSRRSASGAPKTPENRKATADSLLDLKYSSRGKVGITSQTARIQQIGQVTIKEFQEDYLFGGAQTSADQRVQHQRGLLITIIHRFYDQEKDKIFKAIEERVQSDMRYAKGLIEMGEERNRDLKSKIKKTCSTLIGQEYSLEGTTATQITLELLSELTYIYKKNSSGTINWGQPFRREIFNRVLAACFFQGGPESIAARHIDSFPKTRADRRMVTTPMLALIAAGIFTTLTEYALCLSGTDPRAKAEIFDNEYWHVVGFVQDIERLKPAAYQRMCADLFEVASGGYKYSAISERVQRSKALLNLDLMEEEEDANAA